MNPRDSVLVLQHAECEPPAAYRQELDIRGIAVDVVELDQGEALPSPESFDAIVAMGGPMGANDEESAPWLANEKLLIRESVKNGTPYWGVCLGAQLLASSLDARVYRGDEPEVGILPVHLREAGRLDPVFSALPSEFPTLQWHSDTFDLPEGSVLLASSHGYRHQSFRWKNAYGLQFHLEVSPELVRNWAEIPVYAQALKGVMGNGGLLRLMSQFSEVAEAMHSHALEVFRRWLEVVVAPASTGRR